MKIIESDSTWDLEYLIKETYNRLKRVRWNFQYLDEIMRFIKRLPNCTFEDIIKAGKIIEEVIQ